jgi:hypothetical protein
MDGTGPATHHSRVIVVWVIFLSSLKINLGFDRIRRAGGSLLSDLDRLGHPGPPLRE